MLEPFENDEKSFVNVIKRKTGGKKISIYIEENILVQGWMEYIGQWYVFNPFFEISYNLKAKQLVSCKL